DRAPGRDRPTQPEPLWREVIGRQIRRARTARAERLVDVAERAGVSPQYLSEVERGVKDPSSEMLSAIAGALGTSVAGLAGRAYRLVPAPPAAAPARERAPRPSSGPVCLAS